MSGVGAKISDFSEKKKQKYFQNLLSTNGN